MFSTSPIKNPKIDESLKRMGSIMLEIKDEFKKYSDSTSCCHAAPHEGVATLSSSLLPLLSTANDPTQPDDKRTEAFINAKKMIKEHFENYIHPNPKIPFDSIRTTEKGWADEKIKTLFQTCKLKEDKFSSELLSVELYLLEKKQKKVTSSEAPAAKK